MENTFQTKYVIQSSHGKYISEISSTDEYKETELIEKAKKYLNFNNAYSMLEELKRTDVEGKLSLRIIEVQY